ncbi:uncharacterized protein BP5553_04246 [Venustampulla echinocandica]|uniref:C2H2-type domain-containing protein n=1 Tax=Venustampulla echinocandica TaxID=2656787 RepID=A0A370TWK0_9HELO|nr:uncharacterized protein BP5553_04246 [Venustampulla echinocandica]RDL39906.1 hypothetical protein BP5553_04246 [Venustampulla echinocandica]
MANNMGDDLNSSDIEFEPVVVKGRRKRGQQSIQEIIEHADEDRISSKKAIKSLEFGRGAPRTIENAQRWMQRFNAFRQNTLRKSIGLPFIGDDVLRFFDTIIGRLKPHSRGKPVPSSEYIVSGFGHIASYGTFTYTEASGYKLTANDGARLQTWLDDAIKAGRLTKGRWKKKVWLNYIIVSRMTRAWLDHYLQFGARNWDLVIAKLLSIVLITAVGMRVGDVTRSLGYDGIQYVKYKDITLEVIEEAKLANIKARITLSYMKGMKDTLNMDGVFYFRPMEENANEDHMCVISLLLVHALRHGLVLGSTLSEVLENAVASPDSCVVWTSPDRPVLTAILANKMRCVDLKKPAHPGQVLMTLKHMGLISNILSPVRLHCLRYGNAQDVAHLPRDHTAGFVDDTVRQTLSHAPVTMIHGVTEMYTGPHTRETYNDRAAAQYTNHWGAKFSDESALDVVKARVSNDEIIEWQRLNEPHKNDHATRNAKDRARTAIRAQRHQQFIDTAAPERKSTVKKGALSEKSSNIKAATPDPSTKKSTSTRESAAPPIWPPVDLATVTEEPRSSRSLEFANIDPRLLEDEDLDSVQVDATQLEALQSQLLSLGVADGKGEADNDIDITGLQALLARPDVDDAPDQPTTTDFITHLSRINIVNCTRFADQWPKYENGVAYEESIGQYSVRGNSRDSPTPMTFQCQATAQCPHVSIQKKAIIAHEAICSPEYVAREVYRREHGESFHCAQCEAKFLTQHLLNMHVNSVHNFTPTPCPEGCDPAHIYPSKKTLNAHLRRNHSGIWPARCLYPGCTNETLFKSSSYSNHLTNAHDLKTRADRARFFPPTLKRTWQPTACHLDGCTNSHEFGTDKGLIMHLIGKHELDRDAARQASEHGWISQMSNQRSKGHLTRKYRPKQWEADEDASAEDDETGEAVTRRVKRRTA